MDLIDYFGGWERLAWALALAVPLTALFARWIIVDRKWASADPPPTARVHLETCWAIAASFGVAGGLWLLFNVTLAVRGY